MLRKMLVIFLVLACFRFGVCFYQSSSNDAETELHIHKIEKLQSQTFWIEDAQRSLHKKLKQIQKKNPAKNVIFFLGDGMSVPTVTAARIYDGQQKGIIGERNQLSFEDFPYVGLSKTYCVDKQVSDSACTATAYLCGIKSNFMTIGVGPKVLSNDCDAASREENHLDSIAKWAQIAGKATGLITTTRVTHASPAGLYANTANRDIESDLDVHKLFSNETTSKCRDIAKQMIENDVSREFKVILGGGAAKFLHNGTKDDNGNYGERLDGRNLIREWINDKHGNAKFVTTKDQLFNTDVSNTDYLLGLFSPSHMAYHLDADNSSEPTLAEMTEVAIKVLSKTEKGFFLFVEGGRIDHAHHDNEARKALDETVEFSKAVHKAQELTNSKDTLIVVTADHGHTMTISGYPDIDNSIIGLGTDIGDIDQMPYSTLSYANGQGFYNSYQISSNGTVERVDLRNNAKMGDKEFKYPATVPLVYETHGGGDVAIYAEGPWSHLFTGVLEQNTLPHLIGFAACFGPGLHSCR